MYKRATRKHYIHSPNCARIASFSGLNPLNRISTILQTICVVSVSIVRWFTLKYLTTIASQMCCTPSRSALQLNRTEYKEKQKKSDVVNLCTLEFYAGTGTVKFVGDFFSSLHSNMIKRGQSEKDEAWKQNSDDDLVKINSVYVVRWWNMNGFNTVMAMCIGFF